MADPKFTLVSTLARIVARVWRGAKGEGALVIPSAGAGSLGDEAMCESLGTSLKRAGLTKVTLAAREGGIPWPKLAGYDRQIATATGMKQLSQMMKLMREHRYVFVVGADSVDGHYSLRNSLWLLLFVDLAARMGRTATLVGCSYKDKSHPATAKLLSEMPANVRLCVRDAISKERMEAASGRSVNLVADVAFQLRPQPLSSEGDVVDAWVEAQRGRPILGVNFNHQVLPGALSSRVQELEDAYARVLTRIVRELGGSILLMPHDHRKEPTDTTYADRLFARLSPELGDRILRLPGRRTPGEIKHVAGMVDVVLTGRMHLAIACLGRGTPPACVTYQGKFEGLMRHFGLEGMTLDPECACDADALWVMVSGAMSRSAAMREQIRSRLESIQAMSRQNFPDELRSKIEASLSAERDGAPRERVAV